MNKTTNKFNSPLTSSLTIILIGLSILLLQSCSFDDFINGEDNALPPTELSDINNTIGITEQWSSDAGAGNDEAFVRLYPAISDTAIYTIDRDGDIVAFDRDTGSKQWEKDLDMTITSGLGHDDETLYVANDNAEILALDINSGEEKWKKSLSSIALSQPLTSGDILIVRTLDGKLYGLSREDGVQNWIYDRGVPVLTYRGNSSLVLGGDKLVFTGFDSGKVTAVGIEQGQLLWETTAAVARGRSDIERIVDIDGDPILAGRSLFVVTINGRIVSIDAITGKLNWARDMSSFVGIGADERNIYITDSDNNIWAFGQENGNILWKQDKLKYRFLTAPTVQDDNVMVLDFEGYLHILSTIDGEIIGRKQFDSDGYLLPVIQNDEELFLYGNSGSIRSIKLSSE
jgi:outer membrane protein assembly factor BamB